MCRAGQGLDAEAKDSRPRGAKCGQRTALIVKNPQVDFTRWCRFDVLAGTRLSKAYRNGLTYSCTSSGPGQLGE